jgi:hypothetical protein
VASPKSLSRAAGSTANSPLGSATPGGNADPDIIGRAIFLAATVDLAIVVAVLSTVYATVRWPLWAPATRTPCRRPVKAARDEIVWALIDECDMLGSYAISAREAAWRNDYPELCEHVRGIRDSAKEAIRLQNDLTVAMVKGSAAP